MQLTKFTDYSLRVAIYLARHMERLVTIAEIADAYGIPAAHLTKVVHKLGQRGYIVTVRGKGGGMRLARNPDMINIGNLVRDSEDNMDIAECFDSANRSCPMLPACTLKSVLIEARKNFLGTLDSYNLSDIAGNKMALPIQAARLKKTITLSDGTPLKKKRKTA